MCLSSWDYTGSGSGLQAHRWVPGYFLLACGGNRRRLHTRTHTNERGAPVPPVWVPHAAPYNTDNHPVLSRFSPKPNNNNKIIISLKRQNHILQYRKSILWIIRIIYTYYDIIEWSKYIVCTRSTRSSCSSVPYYIYSYSTRNNNNICKILYIYTSIIFEEKEINKQENKKNNTAGGVPGKVLTEHRGNKNNKVMGRLFDAAACDYASSTQYIQ